MTLVYGHEVEKYEKDQEDNHYISVVRVMKRYEKSHLDLKVSCVSFEIKFCIYI